MIGPSGAGKSTLLRIIDLLTVPDSGAIWFNGSRVPPSGEARLLLQRQMTLVLQKPLLFKTSVWENIAYGLKARNRQRDEVRDRLAALLDQFGLSELAQRRADTLSGGEAQRVVLARAVAFEPRLLLLDEPTANLDPANVQLIEKVLLDINRSTGMTIVMVTHNISQARRLSDQVVFLYEGRVVETGATKELFAAPTDPRTLAFVEGQMVY